MRHLYSKILLVTAMSVMVLFAIADNGYAAEESFNLKPLDEEPYVFTLKDLEGNKRSLDEFKDNKIIVLNFWASWCGACKKEMPSLNSLEDKYKDKGLKVIAVAEDSKKRVNKYLDGKGFNFTVLLDPYGKAMSKYKILALPETFIIVDGKVIGRITGGADFISSSSIEYFNELLNK